MTHAIGLALFLAGLWQVLSGYFLGWLLALGGVSVGLVVYIAHRMDVADQESFPIHHSIRGFGYWPWLLKEIVVSNIIVARAVLSGRIQPQVLSVKSSQDSELGRVVYGNSITLTPGTVTIGLEGDRVDVHALLDETAEGVLEGGMDLRVSRMTNSQQLADDEMDSAS